MGLWDSLLNWLSSMPMMEDGDHTGVDSEEQPLEHIIGHEKSATGILCLLKTCHGNEASNLLLTKDVLGIVATLGKVDDDNLSRLLSEYLGIETMLAVVCKTYDGVKALETYENDGSVSKSSGLHGLGPSIGRHLDGRFQVICLENLRYVAPCTIFFLCNLEF
ncbi:protein DEFECTIVE IN MERISTEM SILENCING 3-like [Camellia sinensis]|uniref:protein DEFECTIVE IN MERISTEM SILENCING 3-like n=1 Tax=Camellia sinensis TaxID=4442 RepID=UPI001036EE20|nr:protein DEFECTIVE IN MERISTEM SILENCING 3-like [Camellia sinensis]